MKINKRTSLFAGLFLVATVALAAGIERISKDELILGTNSTDTKTMTFDVGLGAANPRIRGNNASPNLEFASDGTSFLPFGSGSGGGSGRNIIENGDFELGENNWTNAGSGTFTITSTAINVGDGNNSGEWDAAANLDTITSDAQDVPNILGDILCSIEMQYKGGDANITMQMLDAGTPIKSKVLVANSKYRRYSFSELCPAGGSISWRLIASADAAVIYFDEVKIGTKGAVDGTGPTKWQDFTPSFSTDTTWNTSIAKWRRNSQNMEINLSLNVNTPGAGSETIYMYLPNSQSLADGGVDFESYGTGYYTDGSAGVQLNVTAMNDGTGSQVMFRPSDKLSGSNRLTDGVVGAADQLIIHLSMRIAEWVDTGSVNLINDDTVNANARYKASGLGTTAIGTNTQTIDYDSEDFNNGAFINDGSGVVTIPADGLYFISAQLNLNSTSSTSCSFNIIKNGSITLGTWTEGAGYNNFAVAGTFELSKNDTIEITKFTSVSLTGVDNSTRSWFEITRLSDFTAGDAVGFALADADNAGLVLSKENGTFIDGNISGKWTRIGKRVTLTVATSSSSNSQSALGVLPLSIRPSNRVEVINNLAGAGAVASISPRSNGDIWLIGKIVSTGAAGGTLVTSTDFTISYVLD